VSSFTDTSGELLETGSETALQIHCKTIYLTLNVFLFILAKGLTSIGRKVSIQSHKTSIGNGNIIWIGDTATLLGFEGAHGVDVVPYFV
jgi:hypothetical protein